FFSNNAVCNISSQLDQVNSEQIEGTIKQPNKLSEGTRAEACGSVSTSKKNLVNNIRDEVENEGFINLKEDNIYKEFQEVDKKIKNEFICFLKKEKEELVPINIFLLALNILEKK
ncbi:6537_t:CDS:2, partial [Scutellospora calospora]